jgi:hypothetical protein
VFGDYSDCTDTQLGALLEQEYNCYCIEPQSGVTLNSKGAIVSPSAPSHDLFDFIKSASSEMASEYARISKRATEDPGTAGDQGEENWATLLRDWLPSTYQVVTKGRILGYQGVASPQVDVIVLSPSYPRKLLDKKLYLAGGVVAAFECKLTLRSGHLQKAFQNSAQIRRLLEPRFGSPYMELTSPIIYGLLAHSHNWHSKKPENHATFHVVTELQSWRLTDVNHPCEMLDMLCISDLGTYTIYKQPFRPDIEKTTGALGPVGVGYMQWVPPQYNMGKIGPFEFEPIGTMICALLHKLGWEDKAIRGLSMYFDLSGIKGMGGGTSRGWPLSVYSDEVRLRLVNQDFDSSGNWNEWATAFN